MASPMVWRVVRAFCSWAWVRALEKATAAWEARSQPAVSLASAKAPGWKE